MTGDRQTNHLGCVLFILNLGREWCKLFSEHSVPRRRHHHWVGQDWCRSLYASESLSHIGCYTLTTQSRLTSLRWLKSKTERSVIKQESHPVSPKVPLALCHAASYSSHKWWLGRAWEATLKRDKPTSPMYQMHSMPEVIVQLKKCWCWMKNKHHLMTTRAGGWAPFSWKPNWPSIKHLVACVQQKSLRVQRALTALLAWSLCWESCIIFQREITCTADCSWMYPSSVRAERPLCFD